MAKKKLFSADALLRLYAQGSYQKVISKIKQFSIDGMSEEKVNTLKLSSFKLLSIEFFKNGELAKALKSINQVLEESEDEYLELLKLYALCYGEHFNDALILAQKLIGLKKSEIKKEAIFLYLLTKLYLEDFSLEASYMKMLAKSRKNYLLGFMALMQNDRERALDYFKETSPRLNVEKNNIFALVSILEDRECDIDSKPLYRLLSQGDIEGLGQSKNRRNAVIEVKKTLKNTELNRAKKKFLACERPLSVDEIKKEFPQEIHSKALFNSLILYVQTDRYGEAINFFMQSMDKLVEIPESIFVLLSILGRLREIPPLGKFYKFLENYLKKHTHLSSYQLNYIFNDFSDITIKTGNKSNKILENLGKKYEVYIVANELNPLLDSLSVDLQAHIDFFEKFYTSYSESIFESLEMMLEIYVRGLKSEPEILENELLGEKISLILCGLEKTETRNKRLKAPLLFILDKFAELILLLPYRKNEQNYLLLNELVLRYKKIFSFKNHELLKNLKLIKMAIRDKKSPIKEKKHKSTLEMLLEITQSMGINDVDDLDNMDPDIIRMLLDDEEEEEEIDQSELNIVLMLEDFRDDIESGNDGLSNLRQMSLQVRYDPIVNIHLILDIFEIYRENSILNEKTTNRFLSAINFKSDKFKYDLISALKKSPQKVEYKKYLLEICLKDSKTKTQWFLQWVIYYLEIVILEDSRDSSSDDYYQFLVEVYQQKRFKKIKKKYEEIIKRYEPKEILW